MSWILEIGASGQWGYRASLSIDNSGGGAGAFDAAVVIPSDWDSFWDNIDQADARDVRVRRPDGFTAVTKYDFAGLAVATRALTLEIQDAAPAAGMLHYHLYWGNASAVDAKSAFAPAAALTGYAELGTPGRRYGLVQPELFGNTKPRILWSKAVSEQVFAWFDFAPLLQARRAPFQREVGFEEISYVSLVDVQLAGATQAGMFDVTATRISNGSVVGVLLKAGTTGTQYTVLCRIVTSKGRTIEARALLFVQNFSEV